MHSFCALFRKTYRRLDGEMTRKKAKDRHSALYQIGRALAEAIECFGDIMEPNAKVLHGLDKVMYFKALTEYFNAPISTTKSSAVGTF